MPWAPEQIRARPVPPCKRPSYHFDEFVEWAKVNCPDALDAVREQPLQAAKSRDKPKRPVKKPKTKKPKGY